MKKSILAALIAIMAIGTFALFNKIHAQDLTYTVNEGDSLSSIAQSTLGDINRWQDIYNLNRDQISDPNLIFKGEILKMPIVDSSDNTEVVTIVSNNIISQNVVEKQSYYVSIPSYSGNESTYQPVVQAAAAVYGIDPNLMDRIINCESGFNPNAYNPSGAEGIAQFMPGTYYGSWNIYRNEYPSTSPIGQIYAMALKISLGGVGIWECYYKTL